MERDSFDADARWARSSLQLGLVLLGAAAASCGGSGARSSCDGSSAGCEAGFVCIEEQCVPCVTDVECMVDPLYGERSSCGEGRCCTEGEVGCACHANGSCELGGRCEHDLCEPCPPGTESCPCDGEACAEGLSCFFGVCALASCLPGTLGCPCGEGETCDSGLRCRPEHLCDLCIPGTDGCACLADGTCDLGYTCREGSCGPCEDGLEGCPCRTDGGSECDGEQSCLAGLCRRVERLCDELDCLAEGRICEGEPYATCTDCDGENGFVPDGEGGCVPLPGSCVSTSQCAEGEFCLRLSNTSPPFCAPLPECVSVDAPAGSNGRVWDPRSQECMDCPSCVGVEGSTGRLWPTATTSGRCVCETDEGYYFDASLSALAPRPCDEDGDGWVRAPARQFVTSNESVVRDNARCAVLSIESFVLRNERGQQRRIIPADLSSTDETIPLYESQATDSPAEASTGTFLPAYGSERFVAEELNPLTRACASADGDFNANGVPDIEEHAFSSPAEPWMTIFTRMASFVELHRSWFEPGSSPTRGDYYIAERRRCDSSFPIAVRGGSYWRECTRTRPSGFNAAVSVPGQDYAEWSCDARVGSCPVPAGVSLTDGRLDLESGAVVEATVDSTTNIPVHGACSAAAALDPFVDWDGMGHQSQFQCVLFANTLSSPREEQEVLVAGDDVLFDASRCELTEAGAAVDGGAAAVSCSSPDGGSPLTPGEVGWVAYRFGLGPYERGCVDECTSFWNLCPGYHRASNENLAGCDVDEADFGRLECNRCPTVRQPCAVPGAFGVCIPGTVVCRNDDNLDPLDDLPECVSDVPAGLGDPPGDGIDDNCDGFDGDAALGVFVSAAVGSDANPGTPAEPVRTVAAGLALAASKGSGTSVYLDRGLFEESETLSIPDGVSLFGGYVTREGDPELFAVHCPGSVAWCRPPEEMIDQTEITIRDSADDGRVVGFSIGPSADAILLQFLDVTVAGANQTVRSSASVYGLFATDAEDVTLEDVALTVGNAAHGQHGLDLGGTRAADGRNGGLGYGGREHSSAWGCDTHGMPPAGPGASAACTEAGAGGNGGLPGHEYSDGYNGDAGGEGILPGTTRTIAGGTGGSGGPADQGDNNPGYTGLAGSSGENGRDGAAATPLFSSTGYDPTYGEAGAQGGGGSGGGGGGGGGGGDESCNSFGGSGGGGGSGGCGGAGGLGGGGGGGSFGVYLWGTSTSVALIRCRIEAGNGGDGGNGGQGATGGRGGGGGGLPTSNRGHFYGGSGEQDDGSNGAKGGAGGNGGAGGQGGAGAGGPSIAIVRGGATTTVEDSVLVYGSPGAHGVSSPEGTPSGFPEATEEHDAL